MTTTSTNQVRRYHLGRAAGLLLIFLLALSPTWATDFYFKPGDTNSNDNVDCICIEDAPCKTWPHVRSCMNDGDTAIIKNGIYDHGKLIPEDVDSMLMTPNRVCGSYYRSSSGALKHKAMIYIPRRSPLI